MIVALPQALKHLLAIGAGATLAFAVLPQGEDPRVTRGREVFDHAFDAKEGLGAPGFNANSCRACHRDPAMGGAGGLELNVMRMGHDGGGGPFFDVAGGQILSKLYVPGTPGREEMPTDPPFADVFEQRQTPTLFGNGLIGTILPETILANEDPTDANQDGIFGVARRLQINGLTEIGRFGWKAQIPRLHDFVRDALAGEIGLTTADNSRGFGIITDGDGVADPEIAADLVDDLTLFVAQLPAPQRKGSSDGRVALGEQLFVEVGCATCHIPVLQGANGPVPLYSNLLLHDVMGSGYRGMAEPGAGVGMFRTPPLWGIAATAPYLHDGRAETLRDAIVLHAGEAADVTERFQGRTAAEQEALLLFLEDL